MLALDIMKEIAAMAGYTITGSTGDDPANKLRARRRLNIVRTDIISRYGGRWPSQYREGWLPLVALINEGTVTVTKNSRVVTGTSTTWSSVDGVASDYKFLAPDGFYYKIASIQSDTSLTLTQPYQSASDSGKTYQIWKDEYRLYPEVFSIGGFLDYQLQTVMSEAWPRNMKDSYPFPVNVELPNVYTVIGRKGSTTPYSTGTVSGSINDNMLVGSGTSWLSNVEPGFELIINSVTYHVKAVYSDTSIELYQYLTGTLSAASYTAKGKNALIVRFREPTNQRVVHYWYWAKDYPTVNDNDETWVQEMYPEVVILGAVVKDYLDKNDVARANMSKITYENAIKDMKVAEDGAMTGVRTLGFDLPPESRD